MFSTKKVAIVALLLFTSSLLGACAPHGARDARVVGRVERPPDFFMDLYTCWQDKELDDSSTEDCLYAAGEDNASIPEILLADKVVGFEGQG